MSDIGWAIVITAAVLVSAPAWVPLLFAVGGLVLAAVALLFIGLFIAALKFFEGCTRLLHGGKRKPR